MIVPILIIIIIILALNIPKKDKRTIIIQKEDTKSLAERRLEDALLPPERTHVPINIRTQGPLPEFQQVGFIYQESSGIRLPLFGRPEYYGSSAPYEYYVKDDTRNMIKIPLDNNKEIFTNDVVNVSGFQGDFVTEIYELDQPRYIPYI